MEQSEQFSVTEEFAAPNTLASDRRHQRAESTIAVTSRIKQSRESLGEAEAGSHLDQILEEKYHRKITQVKRLIKQLEPHYLNFVDQEPLVDLEKEHLLVDKLNKRINDVTDKYGNHAFLPKKKSMSQAQFKRPGKRHDYNKWYIRPEQRFIEKKIEGPQIDTDHYLQRILEGHEIYSKKSNPFEKKREEELSASPKPRIAINPNIIKKAAKTMEKSERRVPAFFLPYLKKPDEAP